MPCERGQATIEWTAVVLLVAVALAAAAALAPSIDGRSPGAFIGHAILCALRGGCPAGRSDALLAAYGERDAGLLRRYAPGIVYEPGTYTLPVDFRRCRSHSCSDAPDDRSLDVTRSARGGIPAAAFTHVLHRGGETFLQYWFYYPDSPSTFAGSHAALRHLPGGDPADHDDDWEGFQVRVDGTGNVLARATSHHGYQGCKEIQCKDRWIGRTGWTRVSKGSHAGHIPYETRWQVSPARRRGPAQRRIAGYRPLYPGRDIWERTTSSAALELIPVESLDSALHTGFGAITPPWRKAVFANPTSNSTD